MSLASARAPVSPAPCGTEAAAPLLPAALHTPCSPTPAMTAEALTPALLHEWYLQPLFRFVSRQLPDASDAEDVTSEVFAAVFQALPRFRGDCDPYLWLLSIARRKIADHLRKRARRKETPVSALLPAGEEGLDEADRWPGVPGPDAVALEAAREIRRVVDSLKEEQRTALLLKYVEGLTVAEIAVVLRKSSAAVNSLLQRARETALRRGRPYFLENGKSGVAGADKAGAGGPDGSEPRSDRS